MKFLQTGFSCHYENAYIIVELVQSAEISVLVLINWLCCIQWLKSGNSWFVYFQIKSTSIVHRKEVKWFQSTEKNNIPAQPNSRIAHMNEVSSVPYLLLLVFNATSHSICRCNQILNVWTYSLTTDKITVKVHLLSAWLSSPEWTLDWLVIKWSPAPHLLGSVNVKFFHLLDLRRFSQQWLCRVLSSRMWCHVVWYKFTDVSQEHTASIFRVKGWKEQVTSRIRWQGCAFCMLAGNVMSHSRRQYSSCLDLWPSFILHIFWFSGLILNCIFQVLEWCVTEELHCVDKSSSEKFFP
jgi:hypothetical protein